MNKGNKGTSKTIILIHDLHLRNYVFMRYQINIRDIMVTASGNKNPSRLYTDIFYISLSRLLLPILPGNKRYYAWTFIQKPEIYMKTAKLRMNQFQCTCIDDKKSSFLPYIFHFPSSTFWIPMISSLHFGYFSFLVIIIGIYMHQTNEGYTAYEKIRKTNHIKYMRDSWPFGEDMLCMTIHSMYAVRSLAHKK